jgi:glycosyltransferase involved in cell wall biosynthesis
VWKSRSDIRLIVSGDGPEAALVPHHPMIDFRPGYVPEDEVDDMFAEASLVVLPYTQASQSGIGGLALARGIPVIVSDVGSLPDLAADATCVVRAGSSRALARAVLAHIDHDSASRQNTLDFAQERFSWEAVASASLNLYESLAA